MELSSPNVSSNTMVYTGKDSSKDSFDYTAESSLFITYPSQALDGSHLISKSPEHSNQTATPIKAPDSLVAPSPFEAAQEPDLLHGSNGSFNSMDDKLQEAPHSDIPTTPKQTSDNSKSFSTSLNTHTAVEKISEPLISEERIEDANEIESFNAQDCFSEHPRPHPELPSQIIHLKMETGRGPIMSDSFSHQRSQNESHISNWHIDVTQELVSEKPSSEIFAPMNSTRSTELEASHKEPNIYKETANPDMSFNDLVTSFPSLPSSPMRKRYTNSPTHSISSHSEETNFQDSTFFNDTRGQFDLDIDLDDHKFTGETKLSPWRKIQPQIKQNNRMLSSKRVTTHGSIVELSSSSKIEDLSKQLTDCKIQLKLYEKFLQDLIDNDRVDINHLADFQEHLDDGANSFTKLEREHAEICNLVEDLYSSLEEYQEKWKVADSRAHIAEQGLQNACKALSNFLDTMKLRCDAPLSDPQLFIAEASKLISHLLQILMSNKEELLQDRDGDATKQNDTGKSNLADIQHNLTQKVAEAEKWKNESIKLKHDFESLKLDRDNATKIRLQEYQNKIDRLQREIENLSELTRKNSSSDISDMSGTPTREREKFILLQRDYENLQRLSQDRMDELRLVREEYENKLASMNGSLSNRKRELINLRAELADTEGLQNDLETAVGKQRILKSENFKLSWQLDSLSKDKAELQKVISALNEKMSQMEISKEPQEAFAESNFKAILETDVRRFERIYNSLDLLAEESSLREPEQKIKRLIKLIHELQGGLKTDEVVATIKRDHKFVFDYFVRAIDAMVKEHIRILLESSENQKEIQLKEKVKELEGMNAQLRANQLQNSEEEVSILKLRNQQLHEKWKYEREQRVHDNSQATERFHELEEEIRHLRRKLAQ